MLRAVALVVVLGCSAACAGGELARPDGDGDVLDERDDDDEQSFIDEETTGGDEYVCTIATLGCPCAPVGQCEAGLVCSLSTCVPETASAACGNGKLEPGEDCDLGGANAIDGSCRPDCTTPMCGDGVQGGGESCDDGDDSDPEDGCHDCTLPTCGNGVTDPGEDCDDGDDDEHDECLPNCVAAACGDGILHDDVEDCDDLDVDDHDDCNTDCTFSGCGDSDVDPGEECDDNGACGKACTCPTIGFDVATDLEGWQVSGGFGLYDAAPESLPVELTPGAGMVAHAAVPFDSPCFGTDGNRAPPYPGSELETSSATTPPFVIGTVLRFSSWHRDEGGAAYDRKRILVAPEDSSDWTVLVDCAAGPSAGLPFCEPYPADQPRSGDAWDAVVIDTSAWAGTAVSVRFEHDTFDAAIGWEQGWYIDDATVVDCE